MNIEQSGFVFSDYLLGFAHVFILLFHIYAFIFIFIHFRHFKEYRTFKTILLVFGIISLFAMGIEKVMVDEITITIAQYLGIVAGIMGLFLTFSLIKKNIEETQWWIYIPFYILFLIPYILASLYGLSQKVKHKVEELYDEKQRQDIMKSSLTTLILSIPGLAIFLLTRSPSDYYFFLYYICLILILFSISTLYFFKYKDLS